MVPSQVNGLGGDGVDHITQVVPKTDTEIGKMGCLWVGIGPRPQALFSFTL